ncbi:MAG: hypothetical protein KF744_01875 [Taibaiella sp.]|nr:hypothetical protein [Taibaiella sp.]
MNIAPLLFPLICILQNIKATAQNIHGANPHIGDVVTIAGKGGKGKGSNGQIARNSVFDRPTGAADDFEENVYIADNANHLVWKVNNKGVMSVFAGTGVRGYSGDNGNATSAQLFEPNDVRTDNEGNVFIIDQGNNVVRKVNKKGIITTIIGNGSPGFSGDGGPATSASIYIPTSLAIDKDGNIFLADAGNERIRKIDKQGVISTYAGTGKKGYSGDGKEATKAAIAYVNGIATDRRGNLYFAQKDHHVIRVISKSGRIYTFAGTGKPGFAGDGGKARNAELKNPYGLAVSFKGDLYIADNGNGRIRKIDANGVITTIIGGGKPDNLANTNPLKTSFRSLAFINSCHDGSLLIADRGSNRIRKFLMCAELDSDILPKIDISVGSTTELGQIVTQGFWSSDDPHVSINYSGTLKGISAGSATITYTGPELDECGMDIFVLPFTVSPKK